MLLLQLYHFGVFVEIFLFLLRRLRDRSSAAMSSISTFARARSFFRFSLSHRAALILMIVLTAPMAITPATAQNNSVGTCTAAIFPPYVGFSIFTYALLASAVMHFVLLPIQRFLVFRFSFLR